MLVAFKFYLTCALGAMLLSNKGGDYMLRNEVQNKTGLTRKAI